MDPIYNPINDMLNNLDAYVSVVNKEKTLNNKNIGEITDKILKSMEESFKIPALKPRDVVALGAALHLLHTVDVKGKKADINMLYTKIFEILNRDPKFKGCLAQNSETTINIFNNLLSLIESDIQEEVIGQERFPGVIVKQLEAKLNSSQSDRSERKDKIKKMAGKMYPIVILSATLHPDAKIPSSESEGRVLKKDVEDFFHEWRAQFNDSSDNKTFNDKFFGECLKTMWSYKRLTSKGA